MKRHRKLHFEKTTRHTIFAAAIIALVAGIGCILIAVFQVNSFSIPGSQIAADPNIDSSIRIFGLGAGLMTVPLCWWTVYFFSRNNLYAASLSLLSLLLLWGSWISYWRPGLMTDKNWLIVLGIPAAIFMLILSLPVLKRAFRG